MRRPRHVLVTGATGFVGGAVVARLLETGTALVDALVQAPDDAAAAERMAHVLRARKLGPHDAGDRLRVAAGDLTDGALDRLSARHTADIDTVVHCAAGTSSAHGTRALTRTNVDGTAAVLRLVSRIPGCRLHHLSTTVATRGSVRTEADPAVPGEPVDAYARTKLAAELLVEAARSDGLDTVVHRLGAVAGDSRTGVSNPDDHRWMIIRASIAVGAAPLLAGGFRWLPVDEAAASLVALTCLDDPQPRYHLVGTPWRSWIEVFSWIRRSGRMLEVCEPGPWLDDVAALPTRLGRAAALELPVTTPAGPAIEPESSLDDTRTRAALDKSGVPRRPFDAALLGRFLQHHSANGED